MPGSPQAFKDSSGAESSTAIRLGSGQMFDAIARRYDFLNRALSLGIDKGWRRKTVKALSLGPSAHVLDIATGTGDLALEIAKQVPSSTVVGLDPSGNMLRIAERKVLDAELQTRVSLELGTAEGLPFPDGTFDAVTIAFGIRNVPDRMLGLREMRRVLKPGGRVAILELSEPRRGPFSALARFHVHWVVPRLGALLSGAREYRYLQQSIEAFPSPSAFVSMMEDAGFREVTATSLTFDTCQLFLGSVEANA